MSTTTTTTTASSAAGTTTTTATAAVAAAAAAAAVTPAAPVRDFAKASPESCGMSSEALENLSELLKSACADRPGLGPAYPHARCRVVKNGKLVFDETASAPGFEHPDDDSIYRFYSMSKIVTTVAIMQCYEKGLLQLSDPVAKYIPAFGQTKVFTGATKGPAPEPLASFGIPEVPVELQTTAQERQMTIKDLLTHTAGLGYGGLGLSLGFFDDVDLWCVQQPRQQSPASCACFSSSHGRP